MKRRRRFHHAMRAKSPTSATRSALVRAEALALDDFGGVPLVGGIPLVGGVPLVGDVPVEVDTHVAVLVIVPAKHDVRPFTTYPELHWGAHDILLASVTVQLPILAPFAGTADASHELAAHVAGLSEPIEHGDAPETVYPVSHTG